MATDPAQALTARLSMDVLERRPSPLWWLTLALAGVLAAIFALALGAIFGWGPGWMGMNIPVAWAFPIVNTIWWIGIAHAGTFISGVLLLTRQHWRISVSRIAEAMGLFAIVLAGLFPIVHLGRPWFAYWLLPYPNTMGLWPQWRSPLVWDFFSIALYLIFTLVFLYVSLLPDLAILRDRARRRWQRYGYGLLALGWRNSARQWQRYQQTMLLLSALAAPIVVAATGVISLDLSVSIVPGYHFTIFPPYFVVGALYSGFSMVVLIAIVLRTARGLDELITREHIDRLGQLMLLFSLAVSYAYLCEIFNGWYAGEAYYWRVYADRWAGPYAPMYWGMIVCNVLLPQLLWLRTVRRSLPLMFLLALGAQLGMWLERYVIVITSTHKDYLPSAWDTVWPTPTDWALLFGSLGVFVFLLTLFVRLMPSLSIHELREATGQADGPAPADAHPQHTAGTQRG